MNDTTLPPLTYDDEAVDTIEGLAVWLSDLPDAKGNERRAERGGRAVIAYCLAHRDGGAESGEDPATVLSDLLSDLLHLADGLQVDFDTVLRRARNNHFAETHGED